jgi:hypothetical protein
MKSIFITLSLVVPLCACAEVQFTGIVTADRGSMYALTDSDLKVSRWLMTGQTFAGVTVESFDSSRSVLMVRDADGQRELPLKPSKVEVLVREQQPLEYAYRAAESGDSEASAALLAYHAFLKRQESLIAKLALAEKEAAGAPGDAQKQKVLADLRKKLSSGPQILEFLRSDFFFKGERWRRESAPNLPNKSLQPTPTAVTPPAAQEITPAVGVAEH